MTDAIGMSIDEIEVLDTVKRLLQAVYNGDQQRYREMTASDVSSIEPMIAPYRIDSLDFHLNLLAEMQRRGIKVRYDILTPRVQLMADGKVAVATYTLLVTQPEEDDVTFKTTNETRVFEKRGGKWVMVHLHKSQAGDEGAF